MKLVIGLTGPTGAGKSSASAFAADAGFQVIDCDLLAREAVHKGSAGLKAVTEVFGKDILLPDGSLNRKKLAERAFSSKEKTELLNKTLLPYIVAISRQRIDSERVLLDAPTLFESGLNTECDYTVAVLASPEERLKRIMARDNITEAEARLRMSAGKPDEFYIQNADYIIYNNGDEKTLMEEFLNILRR